MTATPRFEKVRGFTLFVDALGEFTLTHEASHFQISGPVRNDAEVRLLVETGITFLNGTARFVGGDQHGQPAETPHQTTAR